MPQEEIEFIFNADGTMTTKVLSSKRNCKEVTKPFEDGAEVQEISKVENPGLKQTNKIKGRS